MRPDSECCLQNYNVINLFLMTNILNSTAAIPVMLGLAQGKLAYRIVTPASVLCGCLSGLLAVIVYGVIRAPGWGLAAADGIHEVFLGLLLCYFPLRHVTPVTENIARSL